MQTIITKEQAILNPDSFYKNKTFRAFQEKTNGCFYDHLIKSGRPKDEAETLTHLKHIQDTVATLDDSDFENPKKLETYILPYAIKHGKREVLHPFRVALSGKESSPSPFEIACIIGRDETFRRLEHAFNILF